VSAGAERCRNVHVKNRQSAAWANPKKHVVPSRKYSMRFQRKGAKRKGAKEECWLTDRPREDLGLPVTERSGDTAFRLRTELSKVAWRFASRRSPKRFGCGLAALRLAPLRLCVNSSPQTESFQPRRNGFEFSFLRFFVCGKNRWRGPHAVRRDRVNPRRHAKFPCGGGWASAIRASWTATIVALGPSRRARCSKIN